MLRQFPYKVRSRDCAVNVTSVVSNWFITDGSCSLARFLCYTRISFVVGRRPRCRSGRQRRAAKRGRHFWPTSQRGCLGHRQFPSLKLYVWTNSTCQWKYLVFELLHFAFIKTHRLEEIGQSVQLLYN